MHSRTLYINIRGRNTQKRQGRQSDHAITADTLGNTRKGDTGEAETSILMTHNSLYRISVTDATLHEWRGWLKAFAEWNTVHQYKGKKHTKETRERVRSHEQTP